MIGDVRLPITRGQLRTFIGWVKATIVVGFWFAIVMVFVAMVGIGMDVTAKRAAQPCVDLGGHYVAPTLGSPAECWSTDGTRRLFP